MSSKLKKGPLKRPRESNGTSGPVSKKPKESIEDDAGSSNNSDVRVEQLFVGPGGSNAAASRVQASPSHDTAVEPSQPVQDVTRPHTTHRTSSRLKTLRHSKSHGSIANPGPAIQGRLRRQRSAYLHSDQPGESASSTMMKRAIEGVRGQQAIHSPTEKMGDPAETTGPLYVGDTDDTPSPSDTSEDYDPTQDIDNGSSPVVPQKTKRKKRGKKGAPKVSSGPPQEAAAHQETQEGKKIREFKAALQELAVQLGIRDEDIISIFEKLGIPLSMDRIEIPSQTGATENQEQKYYTASTVTRNILETYGSWEFVEGFDWKIDVEPMEAVDIYRPLSMKGNLLNIDKSPVSGYRSEQTHIMLHIQILRALSGTKGRLESLQLKLQLPREWGTEENKKARLDSNLDLPQAYKNALSAEQPESETKSQEPENPANKTPVQQAELSTVEEAVAEVSQDIEDPSVKTSSQIHLPERGERKQWKRPVTPESPSPGPKPEGTQESPETPSPPAKLGTIDFGPVYISVIDRLIRTHKLEPTPKGSKRLEELLKIERTRLSHRQSLKTLCERLGTADERDLLERSAASPGAAMWTGSVKLEYPSVQYTPREAIKSRDALERSGNAAVNEYARDPQYGAARRVVDWINLAPIPEASPYDDTASLGDDEAGISEPDSEHLTEVKVEGRFGGLVKGMFWGHKHAKESENKMLSFLRFLRLFGTNPKADYAVCLSGKEWKEWGALMAICVLSGECKMSSTFNSQTEAQLAMNSVPALIMFILLHLSTRTTADQPMQPWMWKYGFVYTEKGVTIFAHFPKLVITDGKARWKFVSVKLSDDFREMWTASATDDIRMRGLAVFDMMRSHTESLLEQLLTWSKDLPKSVVPIMDTLFAKARLEMKDYDWLMRKVQDKERGKGQHAYE